MKTKNKIQRPLMSIGIIALLSSNLAACMQSPNLVQYAQKEPSSVRDDYDFDCPVVETRNNNYNYGARPRSYSPKITTPAPSYVPLPTMDVPAPSYVPLPTMAVPAPPPPAAPPPPPPPISAVLDTGRASAESVVVTGSRIATPYPKKIAPPHSYTMPQETEKYPQVNINGVKQVAQEPVSTFAMETDTASYSNVRRILRQGSLPQADAVRVEEFLNYFKYDYQIPRERSTPFSTEVSVIQSPWAEEKQIVHIGLQGYDTPRTSRPPLNLVLLMDVSGSMDSEDKLPLAKRAVRMLLPNLNANDRISMVVYAGASGVALEPTRGTATRDIVCALENLEAGGSTAGGEGINLAYKMAEKNFNRNGVNRIILMSDGDFNVGISDPRQLRDLVSRKREQGVYLSIFGFGGGNYNDAIMQSLAQNGNGVAAYIDSAEEANRVLNRQFEGTMFPIANDVKAQIEFNPKRVSEYRLIGYETRALNREDFNNDKIDAGEIGARTQVTALYEITPVGNGSSVYPLRYQDEKATTPSNNGEIAYLRLRYKLPGQSQSRLIERAITNRDIAPEYSRAKPNTQFALAVAAFAQKLRNDPWIGNFSYRDIERLAQSADISNDSTSKGELLELIEAAKRASDNNKNSD